jgi:L-lactate dehydrogenase complex protein LldG
MSSRDNVLTKIRNANGGARNLSDAATGWQAIVRSYEQASDAPLEARVDQFLDRLRDYDAEAHACSEGELLQNLLTLLRRQNVTRLVVPAGLSWLRLEDLLQAGIEVVMGSDIAIRQLDEINAVLTESTLAIAETGTIVLQGVAGQGARQLSLVPDQHFCLVRAKSIVATVPEAIQRLQSSATLPTTFISGPSATADIEMTRIKGVHGPRALSVLVVG